MLHKRKGEDMHTDINDFDDVMEVLENNILSILRSKDGCLDVEDTETLTDTIAACSELLARCTQFTRPTLDLETLSIFNLKSFRAQAGSIIKKRLKAQPDKIISILNE